MVSLWHFLKLREVRTLLAPLHALAGQGVERGAAVAGKFVSGGSECELARFHYAGHDPIRLGLFAGLHGDEPAGVISDCFHGILSPPPEQKPRPFNLIFETPARAPFTDQVAAMVAALDTIIASYRGFIAHAQYL